MSFKIGDAVRLKSGGPTMIVNSIKGDIVKCNWIGVNRQSSICIHFLEIFKPKNNTVTQPNKISA
ncbi:DUF2158 domain-containing protein [Agaribacillus aureus]|uniref:DUF2158 domain-containing protein n=1 Tax=Agaribacillus aureus TaxID=3051825 RepID=UPI003D214D77